MSTHPAGLPWARRVLATREQECVDAGWPWGLCDRCTAAAPVTAVGGEKRCPTCAGPDAVTKRDAA